LFALPEIAATAKTAIVVVPALCVKPLFADF
jgi:hypothetical protein